MVTALKAEHGKAMLYLRKGCLVLGTETYFLYSFFHIITHFTEPARRNSTFPAAREDFLSKGLEKPGRHLG